MIGLAMMVAQAVAAAPALPDWMAGCWIEEKAPRWTEECWTVARAGSMFGSNRAGNGERLTMWEAMQILAEPDGTVTFWASPRGAPRSAFPVAKHSGRDITFANAAHDYPQRIRYWREGEMLRAEVSLADGSRPMRWSFRRMK